MLMQITHLVMFLQKHAIHRCFFCSDYIHDHSVEIVAFENSLSNCKITYHINENGREFISRAILNALFFLTFLGEYFGQNDNCEFFFKLLFPMLAIH